MDDLGRLTDVELLALMIAGEADGEPLAGQVAVACVPLERLCRRRWGATLRGVILQRWQFSTFNDDHWKRFTHRIPAYIPMADMAIGRLLRSPAQGATHFCRHDLDPLPNWTQPQFSTAIGRIGNHLFFIER